MRSLPKQILALLVLAALAGCGKDVSMEEYQRQKLQENLGQMEKLRGTYSGILRSKVDNRVLGALSLSLDPSTRPQDSKDGQSPIGSPVLIGALKFLDRSEIDLSAPNGYYDKDTGLYSAEIEVSRTGGGSGGTAPAPSPGGTPATPGNGSGGGGRELVMITGQLTPNVFVGEVRLQNYPADGGRVELVRDGGDLRALLDAARPNGRAPEEEDRERTISYVGNTVFNDESATTKPVRFVVTQRTYGTPEDFLDVVSPVRFVDLDINYSHEIQIPFRKIYFDTRRGYITGTAAYGNGTQAAQMSITCRRQTEEEMTCVHITSSVGEAATSRVKFARGRVDPPRDNIKDRKAVTKTFTGHGYFTPGDYRKMYLKVVYPARSLRDELLELFFPVTERMLQATLIFSDSVSASFARARWDARNGYLDGNYEGSGSGRYIAQMQCYDFYFTESKSDFSCTYQSDRSSPIVINFKYPYNK